MTPQQIIGLGIRLLALTLAFQTIRYLGFTVTETFHAETPSQAFAAYWVVASYFVAAAALWFFPMAIAHKLLPRTKFENRLHLNGLELARVGCGLIGLWLFTTGLISLVWFMFISFQATGGASFFRALDINGRIEWAIHIFQVALAVLLMMRSSEFANLVFKGATSQDPGTKPE